MKETLIPAGFKLTQHKHKFDHLSLLARGRALVNGDAYYGPVALVIAAGVEHEVVALTDCVWYCIHATAETDPSEVDKLLIQPA